MIIAQLSCCDLTDVRHYLGAPPASTTTGILATTTTSIATATPLHWLMHLSVVQHLQLLPPSATIATITTRHHRDYDHYVLPNKLLTLYRTGW